MPYLKHIQLDDLLGRSIDIDLENKGAPRHLVITGPNGSGKTTLLKNLFTQPIHRAVWSEEYKVLRKVSSTGSGTHLGIGEPSTSIILFDALRNIGFASVQGPQKESTLESKRGPIAQQFIQHLVNQKAKQAFANESGELETRDKAKAWFQRLESALQSLFADEAARLEFDQSEFSFSISTSTGVSPLYNLADGHRSVLHIFAELLLQSQIHGGGGVVLIDEIENHLHLELQETILPFLTAFFPEYQFIVATHSPAVISSVPDAVIYDLEKREQIASSDYLGVSYGTLMKSHFGLDHDFDLHTSKELDRLRSLRKNSQRTPAESKELLDLANRLAAKSHMLALEVLLEQEAEKVAQ